MRRAIGSVLLGLMPVLAWAEEGTGGHGAEAAAAGGAQPIILLLTLLGLVSAAYLLTHFVVGRLQRRFLFVSGAEYILLGLLLGPQTRVLDDLAALAPVIAFAAGWLGLLYGMEMDLRRMMRDPDLSTRLAVVESLVSGVGVAAVAWLGFGELLPHVDAAERQLAAGVLGCTAAAGSSSAVDLLITRYGSAKGGLLALLRKTTRLGDSIAILAFGLLICVFHQGDTLTQRVPGVSDWVLFTVALGVALGVLFAVFLANDASENSRFLALVGVIAFASGAAFFLSLSVLAVNLILGVVLINTRAGRDIYTTLRGTAPPVSLVLLIFAGLRLEPVPVLHGVLVGAGYILARISFQALGCWLASQGTAMRRDLFRGLLAQGHVAVAMALSFRLYYHGEAADLVYVAVLASVVLNELLAPRMLKGLLVDAGDVRQDVVLRQEVL